MFYRYRKFGETETEVWPDNKHVTITTQPDGSSALLLDKSTPADTKTYKAIATNCVGDAETSCDVKITSKRNDELPEERPQFMNPLRDSVTDEGLSLHMEATIIGNPIPDVTWTKDGKPLEGDHRVVLTCDGKKVGLCIQETEPGDSGEYICKLTNPLGSDACDAKITIRKIFTPPVFQSKFTDLQQVIILQFSVFTFFAHV